MGKDVYSGHEWNIATVDRIVMLMEEIAVLENKFKEYLKESESKSLSK